MSGFFVTYDHHGRTVDKGLLHSLMKKTLQYRGSDRESLMCYRSIGMAHTLFKTTFQSEYERQPFSFDQKVWIVCSARVDDRERLLKDMELSSKVDLDTIPDSQLILHAYLRWGEKMLEHLIGDFAFVIWDEREEKIFAARDPFGRKQLYYQWRGDQFLIGNTLRSFQFYSQNRLELSDETIGAFLLLGKHTSYDKSLTLFKEVLSLLPAHGLVFQHGTLRTWRYWHIPTSPTPIRYQNDEAYVEHFLEVFSNALKDRLRTPSATILLSGGMDSSSVAALAKRYVTKTSLQAVTVTHNTIISPEESYFAQKVAEHLSLPQYFIDGDRFTFLHPSSYTRTFLSEHPQERLWIEQERVLRCYGRVTLSGSASDELFAYPSTPIVLQEESIGRFLKYRKSLQQYYGRSLPFGIRKLLRERVFPQKVKDKVIPYPSWIHQSFKERLEANLTWQAKWKVLQGRSSPRNRTEFIEQRLINPNWCVDDLLLDNDFVLTEKWNPYLDIRLVEFIRAIPPLPWLFQKHMLRKAMEPYLPYDIYMRPKTALGNLSYALATKQKDSWLSQWQGSAIYNGYISKDYSIPLAQKDKYYITELRPIFLDTWISKIDIS